MNKIYIVEGKRDEELLRKVNPNFIIFTTNGYAYSDKLIKDLQKLESENEIVLILDPDYPGQKIRDNISKHLKNPKHVYLPKELAVDEKKKKVGLEHVEIDKLSKILENEIFFKESDTGINLSTLIELKLSGSPDSSQLRKKVLDKLNLPYCNAKRMVRYLNQLGITKEKLIEVINES